MEHPACYRNGNRSCLASLNMFSPFALSSLPHFFFESQNQIFSSPTGYCNKLQLHLYQGRCMYPLRYVFSSSFPVRICQRPDITKRTPDHPQKGRCCRGGCDSHPQPESKQDCVISVTSCPTASLEPKEQWSASPNTDIYVDRTPVSS